MVGCPACGTENPAEQKFCGECGAKLAAVCASCGTGSPPGQRFCGQCGSPLTAAPAPARAPAAAAAPLAERRLVTVLFADLVGFTAASEGRDAEDTRDLLSRYFDVARTVIARYGGTVEKFIGDAVMAVWGTPVATEDDAERAVRAALELVAAVPELADELRLRAGVLTGEAAVTLGAAGEGMVAGDLVNTASRIQSAAEPGQVLVGERTRRATEEAVLYDAAGARELKGKAEAVELFHARRIVSGVRGTLRSTGLEAPFAGRERELARLKDLFHACADEGRAHLVSVTGIPGIGKSRLGWEFYKYFDGIVEPIWWHRGRCPAYGEGVSYWALADMVRMRCRIGEDEDPSPAREKLAATLAENVPDPEERAFVAPRVARLLGLDDAAPADRQDLFAAWRIFFERLADTSPVVLVFEDVQWADMALLDFIEHLLDWASHRPLYVITLGRPELFERRPTWGAGQRNFTAMALEPLPPAAMKDLLDGLAPDLEPALHARILDRAQGVPLYAVETVRMLLDRPNGDATTLDVPETLQALISARLDGLTAQERRLVQDASVLGKTFSPAALADLTGMPAGELAQLLTGLVRKELLTLQTDDRSPERGQYGFLQDLVRDVAYGTLAKRERHARHLAVAERLERDDDDDLAEVLASHYVAAMDAAATPADARELRAKARATLGRAGDRADTLGAPEQGARYLRRAAELATDGADEAALLAGAGRMCLSAGDAAEARRLLERAIELHAHAGDASGAARASIALAEVDVHEVRLEEGTARLEAAVAELERSGQSSVDLAAALAALGRLHALAFRVDDAMPRLEAALAIAVRLQLDDVFVSALTSKANVYLALGRLEEARILLEASVDRARTVGLAAGELRALNNLSAVLECSDRLREAVECGERGVAVARRRGDRGWEARLHCGPISLLVLLGRWDEAEAIRSRWQGDDSVSDFLLIETVRVDIARGDLASADRQLAGPRGIGDDPLYAAAYLALQASALIARGRNTEALAATQEGLEKLDGVSPTERVVKLLLITGVEAALAMPDLNRAEELLGRPERLAPGERTPLLEASVRRLRARLDAARGRHDGVADAFARATDLFAEHEMVFLAAVTRLEHAEWLAAQGRDDEAAPLAALARETFAELRATPWLERVDARRPAAISP